jgi:malyl-CoA/(S)-citramalyl-CoA lyase
MSHTIVNTGPKKAQRSQLALPANRFDFFEKAARSPADAIFLDLEDSVAIEDKHKARDNAVKALNEIDWSDKLMLVRINGLDTQYMYQDLIDIVKHCPRLDRVLIPKVGVAADVYALDMLVTQIEKSIKRTNRLGFECLIETALGMSNVEQIVASSQRVEALSFGLADYAASLGTRTSTIGANHPDYGILAQEGKHNFIEQDMWHYAQMRILNACKSHGLCAIDGPFGDFNDKKGYRCAAKRVAALGFDGKWAIHPSQIELANEVFKPSNEEIEKAQAIIQAMQKAQAKGLGAASLDGELIDIASIKMAESILSKALVA